MTVATKLMVVGGDHPPWTTVRNSTRWFYTTSNSNAGLVNLATNSPGPNWTLTGGAAPVGGAHTKWWNSGYQVNGNGRSIIAASSANHTIGTNDFLMEWWQWTSTLALENNSVKIYMDNRIVVGTTKCPILYSTANDGRLQYTNNVGADLITTAAAVISVTPVQFISICRNSGTTRLFVGGTQVGSVSDSTDYVQTPLRLGCAYNGGGGTTLQLAEFRLAIGSGAGIRTADFTVPTGPFPIGTP